MNDPTLQSSSSGSSFARTVVAVLVLLVVGYFLLHVLIGVAMAVAGFVLVILAIVAVVWAVRVLL
jgi:protein-S-isoprenylcysteine O-methyltransferase Ste14